MKDNVDLTENRDFEKRKFYQSPFWKDKVYTSTRKELKSAQDTFKDKGLVLQGNKRERYYKKLSNSFQDKVSCDRCGRKIYPYENDTLCKLCRHILALDFYSKNVTDTILRKGIFE